MAKQIDNFWQFVSLVTHVRILDHIRSQIDETVVILVAHLAHFVLPRSRFLLVTLLALYEVFPG